MNKLADEANVPRFSLHDLRATGNTWLANAGVDQRIRQYLMGHRDGGPVIARYTKITADTEQQIREAVAARQEVKPCCAGSEISSSTGCVLSNGRPSSELLMPIGTCALCHQIMDLQDSHLLPKAIYKLMQKAAQLDGQKNSNPIIVNTKIALKTSAQVSDYLLCKVCEARFSSGGEQWVVGHCWQPGDSFPLRTALEIAVPIYVGTSGLSIYEAAGIANVDVNRIVYFAASVFWRAAVHQFSPILGVKPNKLDLGSDEEALRQFLIGQQPFPSQVALIVTASSEKADGANEHVLFPSKRQQRPDFVQYGFVVPGITLQLFVGNAIPATIMDCCLVHSPQNRIFLGPNDGPAMDMWKLISKAEPKGDLKV